MKIHAPLNLCVECDEIITNPICTECLADRMRTVVAEQDPMLAAEIRGFELEGETQCILCHKNMAICAHCFSKDMYEFLQEKNSGLAADFASRFDFEIRRDLVDFA